MNNQKKYSLRKRNKENKKERRKNQDDLNRNDLSVECNNVAYRENLDYVVQGLKTTQFPFESFQQYEGLLYEIINRYDMNMKEIDYQLQSICNVACSNLTNVEKMNILGKVGQHQTILDKELANNPLDIKNHLKIETVERFTSIRSNNCVYKGKWCYEVTLLTNKLSQIGWCQLNTPFKQHEGIGDHPSSYAYDGWRVLSWNGKPSKYGEHWDIGDTIGVCIDLEEHLVEYFRNGKKLGIAFTNIPVGTNIAYFPGISLSDNERVIFNFGASKPSYAYPGYNFIDCPSSIYSKSYYVSKDLIELVKSYAVKLFKVEISKTFKFFMLSKIFLFISNISLNDTYILEKLIFPYLCSLDKEYLSSFLEYSLMFSSNNQAQLIPNLIDNLTQLIQIKGLKIAVNFEEWRSLINLFIQILKIEPYAKSWVDNRRYIENLKQIFTIGNIQLNKVVEFVLNKKQGMPQNGTKIFKKFYFHSKAEYEAQFGEHKRNEIDEVFGKLINFMLNDTRPFVYFNKTYTLQGILFDYYVKHMKDSLNSCRHHPNIFHFISGRKITSNNENFIKNFYFNCLTTFLNSNPPDEEIDLSRFSTEPWINRLRSNSAYYDEIGIGGTINHVSSEYANKILPMFKNANETTTNFLLHRIFNMTSSYVIPVLKDFSRDLEGYLHQNSLKSLDNETKRGDYIILIFRNYFNIFTPFNQKLLASFMMLLSKWLNKLIAINRELLYFIPKSIMGIPFDILKFLIITKSSALKETNGEYNNKLIYPVLHFYLLLFNDDTIAHPEMKESFMYKVSYIIKKKKLIKFLENQELFEMLIKGLLKYMANEQMYHFASDIMVKIIKPSCFGQTNSDKGDMTALAITHSFFAKNLKIFHEFMNNYNDLINKIMTEYVLNLSEATRLNSSTNDLSIAHGAIKRMIFSFTMLCDLFKILEFLLNAYPNEFIDVKTLNFNRFAKIIKNISSRILDKEYVNRLLTLIEKYKPGKSIEYFTSFAFSVIGIFLNLEANKTLPGYNEFVQKLLLQSDFDVEPLKNILIHIPTMTINDKVNQGIEQFRVIVDNLLHLRPKKVEKKMSESEWEETNKNEKICIICYVNENDRILLPCRHECCNECLMQYLIDKNKCFICNTVIESTKDIH